MRGKNLLGIEDPSTFAQFWRIGGELTTQLVRVGWLGIGFTRHQMDTLAAHHFNVALLTLIFGKVAITKYHAKFDLPKALRESEVHDLSEFGGGDIGVPRASEFPILKDASRAIEEVNRQALVHLLGPEAGKKYLDLALEEMEQKTDEALFVKLMDRLEALAHLQRMRPTPYDTKNDDGYYKFSVFSIAEKMQDSGLKYFCVLLISAFQDQHKQGRLGPYVKPHLVPGTYEDTHPQEKWIQLIMELQRTKDALRTGWAMGGMSRTDTDTIADHGHVTAIGVLALSWLLEAKGIEFDSHTALQMALVQEIGKLYGGDISPVAREHHKAAQAASHEIRKTTAQILWSNLDSDLERYLRSFDDPNFAASSDGSPRQAPKNDFVQIHDQSVSRANDPSRVVLALGRMADHIHYDLTRLPERRSTEGKKYIDEKILGVAQAIEQTDLRNYLITLLTGIAESVAKKELRRPLYNLVIPSS